jgi:hypothetical protein
MTLFGWVLATMVAFSRVSTQQAVVFSVICGFLLLPVASYHWQGIPTYDKSTAIALGLLLGGLLSGSRKRAPLRLGWNDFPMILWCFVVPLASALSNGLGWHDGLSGVARNFLCWGVFFWAGKRYLNDSDALRTLALGVVFGGLLYFPLILFEIRMSPQLSNIFYGFFPHSFAQHIRFGGYRPIVFMEHGLMVSLWMALATTTAYWLWRAGRARSISGIPWLIVFLSLFGATLLCKSGNGWFGLAAGIGGFAYYRSARSTRLFQLLLLLIPFYMVLRITNAFSAQQVESLVAHFFAEERVQSLGARLLQEELFNARALERLLFGWGSYGAGWPVDPMTGQLVLRAVDSLWVITLNKYGTLGLASLFLALGIGPWLAFGAAARARRRSAWEARAFPTDAVALGLIVTLSVIDSLVNALVNPIYVLVTGALVGYVSKSDWKLADASAWRSTDGSPSLEIESRHV